jgi:NADPH2:quinone reductase
MAVNTGARVIATTRNRECFAMLQALGAERVELEGPDLSKRIAEAKKLDAVLDLVGNSTILDSLAMLRRGGRACLAGWLGVLAPITDFNPLLQMASGVFLTFVRQLRVRNSRFPAVRRAAPGDSGTDGGRPPEDEAVTHLQLRSDSRGASRDGSQ